MQWRSEVHFPECTLECAMHQEGDSERRDDGKAHVQGVFIGKIYEFKSPPSFWHKLRRGIASPTKPGPPVWPPGEGHFNKVQNKVQNKVASVFSRLVGIRLDPTAAQIAQLPGKMGGFGLRKMTDISTFAPRCMDKGEQHLATAKMDEARRDALFSSLSGLERSIVLASSKSSRPLVDASLNLGDRAWTVWARQRLLLRVLPPGVKCVCGGNATNDHVNTCARLSKLHKHDDVLDALAMGIAACGKHCHKEPPAAPGFSKARPDIRSDDYVTDVMLTYPGVSSLFATAPAPFAAAKRAAHGKEKKWTAWAEARGYLFTPFIVESTGGILGESRRWLRLVIGDADSPITITTMLSHITGQVVRAALKGAVALFAGACG